jgi:beta-1,4-mannosyltransferase
VRATVAALRGLEATLRVTLHPAPPLDDPSSWRAALVADLERAHAAGDLDLVRHERWDDARLHHHLAGLDVLVLPYRHGTHSGMVELCHDLGTAVVAPDVGRWHEQRPVHLYRRPAGDALASPALAGSVLAGSVREAVTRALRARPAPAGAQARTAERARVARTHLDVYRRAVVAAGGGAVRDSA